MDRFLMADRIDVPSQPGYDEVFRSRDGLVGRDLWDRAGRVVTAARSQAGMRSGRLKRSIDRGWKASPNADTLVVDVGSDVPYAEVHHEGARRHVIRARNASVLRFIGSDGRVHFSYSVNHPGHRANHYLTDHLGEAVR